MNLQRRKVVLYLSVGCTPGTLVGCRGEVPPPRQPRLYTDEERARMHKFRGVLGMEVRVDALTGMPAAALYTETGEVFECCSFAPHGGRISSRNIGPDATGMPGALRMMRYADDAAILFNSRPFAAFDREALVDLTVPIADRFPDDLLDDLRRDRRGELRLKLRLHRDGVLVGWDIERRPGFDPKRRDQFGVQVYVPPVHSFAGGDFREAQIVSGIAVRKGWYIDPRTGQKIETDF